MSREDRHTAGPAKASRCWPRLASERAPQPNLTQPEHVRGRLPHWWTTFVLAGAGLLIAACIAWQQTLMGACVAAVLAAQIVCFWGRFATGLPIERATSFADSLAKVLQYGAQLTKRPDQQHRSDAHADCESAKNES